jgi:hypothetical protein
MKRLGMSERQYAAHAGITRGAVSKARLFGRLVLHPDGSIDAGRSDQRRETTTDPSQQRGRHAPAAARPEAAGVSGGPEARSGQPGAAGQRPAGLRPVPQAAVGAVAETLREQGLPSPEGKIDFMAARTANEVLKARLRRMELQQKEGELVDRARATALVFRLARQERDVWLGWPARVAALMAAELGVGAHALQTVLETHVREHLGSLAEVRPELR